MSMWLCRMMVSSQISDLCALCGVSDLAIAHNAVLDAADGADLGFDAHALGDRYLMDWEF